MRVILACALLCAAIPAGGAPARAQAAVSPPAAIREGIAYAWDGGHVQRTGPAHPVPRPQHPRAALTRSDIMRSEAESLIAFGLPAAAVAEPQQASNRWHSLYPANDLDADGRTDVYESSWEDGRSWLAARAGDGERIFWRRETTGATFFGAVPAVNDDGTPVSLMIVSVISASSTTGLKIDKSLGLIMVGPDGETLWERWWDGATILARVQSYYVATLLDWPFPLAVTSMTGDAASDAAVGQITDFRSVAGTRIETIDGSTGETVASFEERGVVIPSPAVVGDLSGDGYADVVFLSGGVTVPPERPAPSLLTARQGTDGAVVWRVVGPRAAAFSWISGVGDITGDGRDDVRVVDVDAGFYDPSAERLFLIDGTDGRVLLSLAADSGHPIGPRDAQGRPLIGVWSAPFDWDVIRADYTIVTIEGTVVAHRPKSIAVTPESGAGFAVVRFDTGDLNADGTRDGSYLFKWRDHTEGAAVDGATAGTLWEDEPGEPLWASTDGDGDDLTRTDQTSRTVGVIDGRTNRLRWSRTFNWMPLSFFPTADVNGDGLADLLVPLLAPGYRGLMTAVVNGADGTVLWSTDG